MKQLKDLLAKAGTPLSPGEGFQGVVHVGSNELTPYPTIDAYLSRAQVERGIYGTNDQERNLRRIKNLELKRAA